MATFPNTSKGEGLIRTYDLLTSLISDVKSSSEYLENDKDSQYLRRNYVRSVFSFIEAIIQILKFEVKADFRLERVQIGLNKKETEILHETRIIDNQKIPWYIPLDVNVKKTIALVIKVWGLKKDFLDLKSENYQSFLTSKHTRNKLTHPRTYYNIEISIEELKKVSNTFNWFRQMFNAIMKERIAIIINTMPKNIRNGFRVELLKEYCC